jgi:hypothetical protein
LGYKISWDNMRVWCTGHAYGTDGPLEADVEGMLEDAISRAVEAATDDWYKSGCHEL